MCFPELGVRRESKSENGNSGLKQEQQAGGEKRGESVRAARTDERTPPIPAPMCVASRHVELQAQIKTPRSNSSAAGKPNCRSRNPADSGEEITAGTRRQLYYPRVPKTARGNPKHPEISAGRGQHRPLL